MDTFYKTLTETGNLDFEDTDFDDDIFDTMEKKYDNDNAQDIGASVEILGAYEPEPKSERTGISWVSDMRMALPKTAVHVKAISPNVVEPVLVTDVNSPSDFFVQLQANAHVLSMVKEELAKNTNTEHSNVVIGHENCELYSVFASNQQWCRCTIINAVEENGQKWLTVYSVDYGFVETVHRDRIRICPNRLKTIPPLAFKCALHDAKPKDQTEGWSDEAYRLFCSLKFAQSGTFYLYPVVARGEHVEVDVVWHDQYPMSIRSALFFFGYASSDGCYQNDDVEKEIMKSMTLPRASPLDKNRMYNDVILGHTVSPGEFYIRPVFHPSSAALYELMTHTLQTVYRDTEKRQLMFTPKIGMAVAAKRSVDNAWYRAEIVEVLQPGTVTVFYVDFGGKETLSWHQLRMLDSRLIEIPAQAFRARLKGLVPAHDGKQCNEWSPEANAALADMAAVDYSNAESLDVYVHAVNKDGVLSVTMVKSARDEAFNVNHKLGSMSCALLAECTDDEQDDDGLEQLDSIEYRPDLVRSPSPYDRRQSHCTAVQDWPPAEPLYKDLIEARVTHVDDRCVIYFHDAHSDAPRILRKLSADLDRLLADSVPEPMDYTWADGQMVLAKYHVDDSWCRATVLSGDQLTGDYTVRFVDYGNIEVCSHDDLRHVATYEALNTADSGGCRIQDVPKLCHEGYFRAVVPIAANIVWPASVCNFVRKELVEIPTKMTISGDIYTDRVYAIMDVRTAYAPKFFEYMISLKEANYRCGIDNNEDDSRFEDGGFDGDKLGSMDCELLAECTDDEQDDDELEQLDSFEYRPDLDRSPSPYDREQSHCTAVQDWLPAEPLYKDLIEARVTHVDDRCAIYFHDAQSDAPRILRKLSADLDRLLADSVPEPMDYTWADGQMVLAKYHADDSWYRATVLSADDLTGDYTVRFVDYGNIEVCSHDDLRHVATYEALNTAGDCGRIRDVPKLCHEGYFRAVVPIAANNVWPASVCNFVCKELVEMPTKMTISADIYTDQVYAIMDVRTAYAPKFFEYMISLKKANYRCGIDNNEDDSRFEDGGFDGDKLGFAQLDLSAAVSAEGVVTQILGPNKVSVVVNKIDGFDVASAIDDMNWLLQKKCPDLVRPRTVTPGTPVCVFYKYLWRRAVVVAVDPTIVVSLVDLDIATSVHNIEHVRSCPQEFLAIPACAIKCQLANVATRKDSDENNLATRALSRELCNCHLKKRIETKIKTTIQITIEKGTGEKW
ncbi:tudor domain-containing protein 1-like [Adelges cooleyi]|uniref:tudor domain-containing protein 1-like n=1 Tax=Adelges cooleyi TaxID=133065 RepID=UPI00217FF956|nr:tudor domain-containing protein 1-like [Adelges cooleyi]